MYAFCQDMPGITVEDQAKLNPLLPPEALDEVPRPRRGSDRGRYPA